MLVPLPTAAADHQATNAVTLERAGAAIHIPQSQFTVDRLDAHGAASARRTRRSCDRLARGRDGAGTTAARPRRSRDAFSRSSTSSRLIESATRANDGMPLLNAAPYFSAHASPRLRPTRVPSISSASPARE